jgi:hypothetical protein
MTERQIAIVTYFATNRNFFNFNNIEKDCNFYQGFFHYMLKGYDNNLKNLKVKSDTIATLEKYYDKLILSQLIAQ